LRGVAFKETGFNVVCCLQHLQAINAADRSIKALEAAARTRQIKIDQRNKVVPLAASKGYVDSMCRV
jgi:hypothetical protein